MLEMYAPDAVFDVSRVFTDVAPAQGHREMLAYWSPGSGQIVFALQSW